MEIFFLPFFKFDSVATSHNESLQSWEGFDNEKIVQNSAKYILTYCSCCSANAVGFVSWFLYKILYFEHLAG